MKDDMWETAAPISLFTYKYPVKPFDAYRSFFFLPVATVVQRLCSRNVDFNSRSLTLGFEFWPYAVLHGAYLHIKHHHRPQQLFLMSAVWTRAVFGKRTHFRMPRLCKSTRWENEKSRLKSKFEQHCRTVSLECNTKGLTWRLVTFATYDMSSLTSTSSPLMDQDHENSSQKKKWITTLNQLTLTAILKL
jgi:hypothetical protein